MASNSQMAEYKGVRFAKLCWIDFFERRSWMGSNSRIAEYRDLLWRRGGFEGWRDGRTSGWRDLGMEGSRDAEVWRRRHGEVKGWRDRRT